MAPGRCEEEQNQTVEWIRRVPGYVEKGFASTVCHGNASLSRMAPACGVHVSASSATVYMTNSTYVCCIRRVHWVLAWSRYTLTHLGAPSEERVSAADLFDKPGP